MHTTTITTRRRRLSGLLSIGAIGLLAAGCSGAAGSADAAAGGAGGAAGPAAAQVRDAGPDTATSSHDTSLPDSWQGTLVAVPGVLDGSEYVALQNSYGPDQPTSVSGEQIAGGEFLAGMDAVCEGTAVLNGAAATCTLGTGDDASLAMVRLVPTGFGNTGLLFHVTRGADPSFTVPADVPIGNQVLGAMDPSDVTQADIDDAAISAVMMGDAPDGDLPSGLDASCDLDADGLHAVCELTGTTDGAGDGTWYATAHQGFDGDRLSYVFSQLPQE